MRECQENKLRTAQEHRWPVVKSLGCFLTRPKKFGLWYFQFLYLFRSSIHFQKKIRGESKIGFCCHLWKNGLKSLQYWAFLGKVPIETRKHFQRFLPNCAKRSIFQFLNGCLIYRNHWGSIYSSMNKTTPAWLQNIFHLESLATISP